MNQNLPKNEAELVQIFFQMMGQTYDIAPAGQSFGRKIVI